MDIEFIEECDFLKYPRTFVLIFKYQFNQFKIQQLYTNLFIGVMKMSGD